MHPALEPVAEDLARPSRIMLAELIGAGLLAVEVIDLPDAAEEDIADRAYCRDVRMRWRNSSDLAARSRRRVDGVRVAKTRWREGRSRCSSSWDSA